MPLYQLIVVDDECEIRSGLCNYFPWENVGFEVAAQFSNGAEALAYLSDHTADAMLCDIRMPIMTGLELARELHERKSQIKIVFISAYRNFEYAQMAIEYGARKYIVRPTKYGELMRVFTELKEELDHERAPDAAEEPAPGASVNDKVIAIVQDYVKENYRDASLEAAARLVYMSPYYLSKVFKEKSGQLFSNYVIDVRMRKAAELLLDIRLKTYEVSEAIGYSNVKNFTRRFTAYYNMSPREYRLSHQDLPSAWDGRGRP